MEFAKILSGTKAVRFCSKTIETLPRCVPFFFLLKQQVIDVYTFSSR